MPDRILPARTSSAFAPLLWAVFLGCSWTWVIGMFVPVLLVRDFGAWAWAVFAVPNVVGAAAMGWVLRDAAASERFVHRHAAACYAFSIVTVAFHVFFAMWMIQRLHGLGVFALGTAGAMLVAGYIVSRFTNGRLARWAGAVAVMALSVAMWNMLAGQGGLAVPPATPLRGGDGPGLGLAYLAPVFLIGFALNPYLDLTFHRARRSTSPAGGRVAFGVGFGVVFLSMIVFTLLYAKLLWRVVDGQPMSQVMSTFLSFHLVAQSAFTIAAHLGELPVVPNAGDRRGANPIALASGVAFILVAAAAVGWHASTPRTFRGHDLGEVVYWCFLGFYGFVFPGYVWLCAYPGKPLAPQQWGRAMGVLALVVVVAFPMYWMGFVEGRHVWLVPGLLVLLASRALLPRRGVADAYRSDVSSGLEAQLSDDIVREPIAEARGAGVSPASLADPAGETPASRS